MALFQPGRRGFINRSVSFSRPRDYQTSGLTKKTRANLFRRFRRGLGNASAPKKDLPIYASRSRHRNSRQKPSARSAKDRLTKGPYEFELTALRQPVSEMLSRSPEARPPGNTSKNEQSSIHLAKSARGMAFPSATQPALLGCKWSPLSYAGSSWVGWFGSRTTASRSTIPSNSPLLRIQSLTF